MKTICWLLLCSVALLVGYSASDAIALPRDGFIVAMEQVFGVAPGVKKPVMQCQCSVEYLYTRRVSGKVYAVYIEKLD